MPSLSNLPMALPSLIYRLARLGLVGINGVLSTEITGTRIKR